MPHTLVARLHETGVELVFSGLKKQILDVMRTTGLLGFVGEANIFATENQALTAICRRLGAEAEGEAMFCQLPRGKGMYGGLPVVVGLIVAGIICLSAQVLDP